MSGYCDCACGTCFDSAISSGKKPALCLACKEAGCEVGGECCRECEGDDDEHNEVA